MKTVFPEDLSVLSVDALEALKVEGLAEFDTLYVADFSTLSPEQFADLDLVTDGLNLVKAELSARQAKSDKLAAMKSTRDELATITINSGTLDADIADPADDAADAAAAAPADATTLTAAADREATVELAVIPVEPVVAPADLEIAFSTGEIPGMVAGSPLTWNNIGEAMDRKLERYSAQPYEMAARSGQPLQKTETFAAFKKGLNLPAEQRIEQGASQGAIRRAIEAARDQTKLKGGSLIASGGWGAPSNISYDRFPKLSSQDGMATFPEVGVTHGGLQMPHGSTFAAIYASPNWISVTEAQDIAGQYAIQSGVNIAGVKPVYRIPATVWVDYRLRVDGIRVQAGILQSRGYPEGIAEELAMVLDAHAHIVNAKVIAAAVAGSTAVSAIAGQIGATAPILTMIELQVQHFKDTHRMPLDTVFEAKFPFWVKGVFRADISRRIGVMNPEEVTDAQIDAWFSLRGISAEYVYDWQSIAGTAVASYNQFPTSVSFLLYPAGTWIKGTSDIISLDTLYDSTLLGTNDYQVLFTEEGWFLAKAGPDSRVVTVNFQANGAMHIGEEIQRSGATT